MARLNLLLAIVFAVAIPYPNIVFSQEMTDDKYQPKITLWQKKINNADPEIVFRQYAIDLSEFDINVTKPDDYRSLEMNAMSRSSFFNSIGHHNLTYQIGLQSPDEKAVFLYPLVMLNFGVQTLQQGYNIADELRWYNCDENLDVSSMINVIAEKDMSQYAYADTAVIYEFKLDSPYMAYMNRYNHCIGVYLRKYGHPAMLLKLLLDDEGYIDKDKFLSQMLNNIHFGNKKTELEKFESKIEHSDLDFSYKGIHSCMHTFGIDEQTKQIWKAENDSLNRVR